MSKIWSFLIIISILFGIMLGNSDKIISQITSAGMSATENIITFAGMICFWTGIFNILKNTKAIEKLSAVFRLIVSKLFEKKDLSNQAIQDITSNITSNIIGVGNAATAFGIKAMEEMQKSNPDKSTASNNMSTFVLINTASLQLIPTSIISLRMIYGSGNPTDIIIPVWIVSITSLLIGIISIKILNKVVK